MENYINLDNLKRYDSGPYIGKIDWEGSIGKLIHFRCNDVEGDLKIISYIKKEQKTEVEYEKNFYTLHTATILRNGLSHLVKRWGMKKEFKYIEGEIVNNKKIVSRYRIWKENSNVAQRMYDVQCMKCGTILQQYENNINRSGCGVCSGMVIVPGVNGLRENYLKLFNLITDSDAEKYGTKSSHKVNWQCDVCKNINYSKIYTLTDLIDRGRPLPCKYCGDGFSFGEKIVNNVMKFISTSYELQKSFEWSDKRRYDVYDCVNKKNIFIEVNGEQHKDEPFYYNGARSLEEEKANDKYKKHLAKKNCKNVVYINIATYSSLSFDEIKNNIIRSLQHIYNLNKVNWEYVKKISVKSLIVDVCKLFKDGFTYNDIAKIVNISSCTVNRYLHIGNELKLCEYIPNYKPNCKKVICLNNNKIFENIKEAAHWAGLLNGSGLLKCCRGDEKYITAGHMPDSVERCRWAYYEDYLNNKSKIEYLKNRKIKKNQFDKTA